jgi:mannose-1-phosphate guanylyltransferase
MPKDTVLRTKQVIRTKAQAGPGRGRGSCVSRMEAYAVILCGGRGERFWPKSRRANPKQFIRLFGDRSLTQATSDRIAGLCPPERQLFIAGEDFRRTMQSQMKGTRAQFVYEPVGRNTAPAVGLAAVYVARRDAEGIMVVLPADHLIEDRREFLRDVGLAVQLARRGLLVTFGIPPDRPDTGYGYVQMGEEIVRYTGGKPLAAYKVQAFREKPDAATARKYVRAGNYAWNSGMFVWRADVILEAFREFVPGFHAELEKFAKTIGTRQEQAALGRLYAGTESISIDYAVMEKARNVAAVRATFDWDDVGSWLALARHLEHDAARNVANGLFVARNSRGCIVDTDEGIVAALGVENLVIVRSGDAVLVARRDDLDGIKGLLAEIGRDPRAKKSL